MNLEFFVSCRKLTKKGSAAPAADTAKCDTFTIEFDKEWDGLVKLVELRNGEHTAQVFYTGIMPIPMQVCGRGALYLTCYGYRKKGDTAAVVQTVPMVQPVLLAGSAQPQGSTAQPYTPTAFDQMAAQIRAAKEAAEKAQTAARELLAMKEAGAFIGPAGPGATVRLDGVRHGRPAKVENLGTDTHAILRFTLPYGLSEEEKQALQEELLGDIDQALDEILTLQESYKEGGGAQ